MCFGYRTCSVTACSVGVFWFTGQKLSRQLSGLRELSRRPRREFSPFWMTHRWEDVSVVWVVPDFISLSFLLYVSLYEEENNQYILFVKRKHSACIYLLTYYSKSVEWKVSVLFFYGLKKWVCFCLFTSADWWVQEQDQLLAEESAVWTGCREGELHCCYSLYNNLQEEK